jgi:hypothetical protein
LQQLSARFVVFLLEMNPIASHKEFLRVVALRKGKVRQVEFMLREGEKGLSVFARSPEASPDVLINAVRRSGKRGTLTVTVFGGTELRQIGLVLVPTLGETDDPAINAVHFEARIPWFKRLMLWLRGMPTYEYFNQTYSAKLMGLARILE